MKAPIDVVSAGNLVVDFVAGPIAGLPGWGTLVELPNKLEPAIGGNGGIFAVAASRLGLSASVLGKVGRDFFGDWLVQQMEEQGVVTELVRRGARGTSSTVAIVNPEGERSFLHYTGANAALQGSDLKLIPKCRWLHVSSMFLLPGLTASGIASALKKAKKQGSVTSLDVAWDPKGQWDLGDCLDSTDYFMPNIDEGRAITGKKSVEDVARALLEKGARNVVLKLGREGSFYVGEESEAFRAGPFDVRTVDSTGAGDVFDAALVYARLKGMQMRRAVVLANAAGALSVTSYGGTASAPTVLELLAFIQSRKGVEKRE